MIFDPPTRSRRRLLGRLIWPLLFVGLVILGIVVAGAGTDTRSQIEYLTRIENSATEISEGGVALRSLTTRLRTISRDEFVTAIEIIQRDLAEGVALAEEDPPTAALVPVRALFRQAVSAWDEGVTALADSILHAADNRDDNTAIDRVVVALALLRAGDAVYAQLLEEMERDDIPSPLVPLSEVVVSPARGPMVTVAILYVDAARSEGNTLGLRPGLKVSQIVADPPWQVDGSDQPVVPVTDAIVFSVVMTNAGNVASPPQQVVLVLEGGAEAVQLSMIVEPLSPGAQVTLLFDPVSVTPGLVYSVTASIVESAPDVDVEDNVLRVQFRVGDD